MENKIFDIGAMVTIVDDELFQIEDFYFVIIDENYTCAEILNGDNQGETVPLIGIVRDYAHYIVPGFYKYFVNDSDSIKKECTATELLGELKQLLKGQICDIENEFISRDNEEFDDKNICRDNEEFDDENIGEDNEDFVEDIFDFDVVELCESIKEKIINQDELVKKVVTSIVYNQRLISSCLPDDDVRLLKKVLLVMGKTGTGKTEVMKQASKLLGIPHVIEDATKFTMDGYIGRSVSDMLIDLYKEADYNLDLAQTGLLVIDEIDKKRETSDVGSAASTGVQTSLLKMLEGEKLKLTIDKGVQKEEIMFDTSTLTIFLMGAFSEIEKQATRTIGFNAEEKVHEEYTSDDLTNYGLIPELVGRISSVIKTRDLELEDFKDIITKSSISPLKLQEKFYSSLGITLKFDDEFIEKLAILSKEKNIGARGIKKAFDEIFSEYDFETLNGEFEELSFEKGKVLKRKHNLLEKQINL